MDKTMQKIVCGEGSVKRVEEILDSYGSKKILLVCDKSFPFISVRTEIEKLAIPFVKFDGFAPNPLYEQVCNGVEFFNREKCDAIVAVGGGSAIDVAKCIKLFCKMNGAINYLQQEYYDSKVPLIAIPTTAGTGSESTRYAVIYYNGQKQSVTHDSIVPSCAILDFSVLRTLPPYQKKCTMLDALCQGIESWWSVNSTLESKEYSAKAVSLIMDNYKAYIFDNDENAMEKVMLGANYSGRAINITQTTAAHAMSYKLTSLYGIPHGHAVAICLLPLWKYMSEAVEKNCADSRGAEYLMDTFHQIAKEFGAKSVAEAIDLFEKLLGELGITAEIIGGEDDLNYLVGSVNLTRLKNTPVNLNEDAIKKMYKRMVIDEA